MKKRKCIAILLVIVLLFLGALGWRYVRSATWQIQRIYPGAVCYFDPVNSPDYTFGGLVRILDSSYVEMTEDSVGFALTDYPTPVDFALLKGRGFFLNSIRLTRCKVNDLSSLEVVGSPFVVFTDCDFSSLPDEQRRLLFVYDPKASEPNRKLRYSSP